jgi:hypothetical protein
MNAAAILKIGKLKKIKQIKNVLLVNKLKEQR